MTDTVDHPPSSPVPDPLVLNDLQSLSLEKLLARAQALGMRVRPDATRHHLVLDQAKAQLAQGGVLSARGFLEFAGENAVLRWPIFNLRPGPEDALVPQAIWRKLGLRQGLMLHGNLRLPRERERGLVVDSVLEVENIPIAEWQTPTEFDKLTPLFPNRRIYLEETENPSLSARAVDLIAPLGMGQRGLIVAPPRAGKTIMLKSIARAIRSNHPKIVLILLLVDERPEEVTDLRRDLDCEIYSSTFDEPVTRHVQVCEAVSERAKRLVELKKDVVILIDSITRMSRGYNNIQPNKGRTMSGGVDSKSLAKPRKFFGSARNVEEGGSLTILATALVETQSRMDDLIFEEFKGTGNMEVHLDRSIAELRIFPAIHIIKSGTRREELLYHPDEYERVVQLRRQLSDLPAAEAMEVLVSNLQHTKSNAELLMAGLRGV
ncbi:MAG TPA: transcription termination factor Rho [Terrimicrobiaceae bacterium]|nr:transcription termination factor Rho [Terrimicrobiaceae bacterium]